MAAQRHEISLRVLKNISRVSAPFELFQHEFSLTTTTPKCTLHSVLFTKLSHHCDYHSTVMNHKAVGGRQLY